MFIFVTNITFELKGIICVPKLIKNRMMKKQFDFNKFRTDDKVYACPVSYEQVDKHLIKAYSSIVLIALVTCLFFDFHVLFYLITFDFAIRVIAGIKYSPLCNFLTRFFKVTALQPVLVNAGSKKMAAKVGLAFSVIISFSYFMGWIITAKIVISMFIFAIVLDLFFDYCLACKMESMYLSYFKK